MSELDTRIAQHFGGEGRFDRDLATGMWAWISGNDYRLIGKALWSESLDAQQEILAGLRERGWYGWAINTENHEGTMFTAEIWREGNTPADEISITRSTPTLAMAEAIAAALESEAKG